MYHAYVQMEGVFLFDSLCVVVVTFVFFVWSLVCRAYSVLLKSVGEFCFSFLFFLSFSFLFSFLFLSRVVDRELVIVLTVCVCV